MDGGYGLGASGIYPWLKCIFGDGVATLVFVG